MMRRSAKQAATRKRKAVTAASRAIAKRANYARPVVSRSVAPSRRTGFGNKAVINMIYAEKGINITSGALGVASFYSFRINSIQDFDLTGVGHQPTPHDQVEPLFEEYCVTGMRYQVSFANASASNRQIVGLYFSDQQATNTNVTTIMEQGQVSWHVLSTAAAGEPNCMFTGYVSLPTIMGKTYKEYSEDDQYQATFGANPTDTAYLHCFVADVGSSGSQVVTMAICAELTVELKGSKLVAQS